MSIAYLLTGSNQGDRQGYLQQAVSYLNKLAGKVTKCSPVYESPAWGFEHPSPFLNQALELQTDLSPIELLHEILTIENKCGRLRQDLDRYEARTLDIDILFFDNLVLDSKELVVPHPRLHLRRFGLLPLSIIAGDLVHPVHGKTIIALLSTCNDKSEVSEFAACICGCSTEPEEHEV